MIRCAVKACPFVGNWVKGVCPEHDEAQICELNLIRHLPISLDLGGRETPA
jgi:hypothetical protein